MRHRIYGLRISEKFKNVKNIATYYKVLYPYDCHTVYWTFLVFTYVSKGYVLDIDILVFYWRFWFDMYIPHVKQIQYVL